MKENITKAFTKMLHHKGRKSCGCILGNWRTESRVFTKMRSSKKRTVTLLKQAELVDSSIESSALKVLGSLRSEANLNWRVFMDESEVKFPADLTSLSTWKSRVFLLFQVAQLLQTHHKSIGRLQECHCSPILYWDFTNYDIHQRQSCTDDKTGEWGTCSPLSC